MSDGSWASSLGVRLVEPPAPQASPLPPLNRYVAWIVSLADSALSFRLRLHPFAATTSLAGRA
eukprot:scaffold238811_cov31-Tisochrysis_lutea.AAC.7